MRVLDAKMIAAEWVTTQFSSAQGFVGAFLHGSITWLLNAASIPLGSDVDILVVFAEPPTTGKPGKIPVGDLILDVTIIDFAEVATAETVLANYHLAGSLRGDSILHDPSGHLTQIHVEVARNFAHRKWVLRRCEDARGRVLRNLASIESGAPFHDNVTSWLFGTGVTTHILLVAGLRNPTVRTRYLAVRDLLMELGWGDLYEELLALLGCQHATPAQTQRYLDTLAVAFDEAAARVRSPFFFASDISPTARVIAVDASRDLIARGAHRETIFWLVATYARCLKILATDAPGQYAAQESGFRALLSDLGINAFGDLLFRAETVRAALPRIWRIAEHIIAVNPRIASTSSDRD